MSCDADNIPKEYKRKSVELEKWQDKNQELEGVKQKFRKISSAR